MLSFKKKIFIDRNFGTIAVFFMKILVRIAAPIVHRNHGIPDNPKFIAVAKFVGFGSVLYTGLLCRALKERFPKAKLIYITSYNCRELVKRMNYIDEYIFIDDNNLILMFKSTIRLIFRLWHYRPTLYFDMEVYSSWAAIIATLSCAVNRYGFYRMSANFKEGMHTHTIFFNTRRHISQIYNQMALRVGNEVNNNLYGIVNISEGDRETCSGILKELGIYSSLIIIINPNASELLLERRWPSEKWILYLKKAVQYFSDYAFLLIGGRDDLNYTSELYNNLPLAIREKVFSIAGKFAFGPFLALIERSSLMVTNDSGPLHFAVALGKPTVSIWGPGDPEHYAPINGTHKIIYQPVYCSPCLYHTDSPLCKGDNICVKNIQADCVFEATKEILNL